MTRREGLARLSPWALAAVFFAAFALGSGHFAHEASRMALLPEIDPPVRRERLLACSNMEQTVSAPGVADLPADVPGWEMFAVGPDGAPATVVVTLRKEADRVVFYPRFGEAGASVTVEEPVGPFARKLFSLASRADGWSPVGAQYALRLSCVENGWSAEEFPVTLRLTLTGRGTQLWHRGETVFFEVP